MLRTIASRVFFGFLSGLGFALAMLAVFYIFQQTQWSDAVAYRQFDDSVELAIENPRFSMWEGEGRLCEYRHQGHRGPWCRVASVAIGQPAARRSR